MVGPCYDQKSPQKQELRSFSCRDKRQYFNLQKPEAIKWRNLTAKGLKSYEVWGFLSGCPEERLDPGRLQCKRSLQRRWALLHHEVSCPSRVCHFWGQQSIYLFLYFSMDSRVPQYFCVGADVTTISVVITEELASSSCDVVRWCWLLSPMRSEFLPQRMRFSTLCKRWLEQQLCVSDVACSRSLLCMYGGELENKSL